MNVTEQLDDDPLEDVKLTGDGELDMDDEIVPEYSFAEVLIRVCALTGRRRKPSNQRPPRDFVIVPEFPAYLPTQPGYEDRFRIFLDPPEPTPTNTRPKTDERIDCYAERYRRRQALHHPKDCGESLKHALQIRVAPNGRPLVVGEVEQTYQGPVLQPSYRPDTTPAPIERIAARLYPEDKIIKRAG